MGICEETAEQKQAPARGLNRLEVLRGLRFSTWDGAFAAVWSTLTTGAFLTGFALWLGAGSVAIGLLTAIPTLAGLVQIVSSYTGERRSERRWYVALYSLLGRSLWLPILLLPLLLPHPIALYVFLLLFMLSYALVNVPQPAWMSWMSDLVPPDHRGRYFARRIMIAGIVGMGVGIPAAWFLDFATRRRHWEVLGFGTLFGVGVLGGIASVLCVLRQPEPPKPRRPTAQSVGGLKAILAYYRTPFTDLNFRRLILFNTVFGLGQYFAAPFFTVYALEDLKLSYIWLQVLATITSVTTLASMPLWGWLSDRFGNKPLLAIGVCGVFTTPISWIFTSLAHPVATALLLVELNIAGGLFWSVVGLTQFNLLIGVSPPERTPIYVATMAAITGLTGGIAPLLGSATMQVLSGWHVHLFGLTLINYHIAFFISAVLRLAALPLLRPLVDAGARSTRAVLQQLGRAHPRDWLYIRQMQRPVGVDVRLRATEALAESRTLLALDDLQAALTDPSLAVRQEAARALGEIRDRGAVDALIAALNDQAAGLIEEASHALGRIGDRRANGALAALLSTSASTLSRRERMAVAQALGALGGSDAVDALLKALDQTGDAEMVETIVLALGETGSSRATGTLLARLQQPNIARGLRLALIRALSEIGDRAAIGRLRAELAATEADPVLLPLLADALARLQDTEAILLLSERMERLESAVARKQVAHAIGRLLGRGECIYSLLAPQDLARETAVSRLLQDLQRQMRQLPGGDALRTAIDAYHTGEYTACLRALRQITNAAIAEVEEGDRAACRRFLEQVGDHHWTTPPVEIVLLAFCALRE